MLDGAGEMMYMFFSGQLVQIRLGDNLRVGRYAKVLSGSGVATGST